MTVQNCLKFMEESNRIEGITRPVTDDEGDAFFRFMRLEAVTIPDLEEFVKVYQPDAVLRDKEGLNVKVGNHHPPRGGAVIRETLQNLLLMAHRGDRQNAYNIHVLYETLHPFTDCNGRSGRMLWLWMMREAPLGFLHTFYYQALGASRP